jgi:hypothetical protein
MVLTLAVDTDGNWVTVGSELVAWEHLVLESSFVCAKVDGQLGCCMPCESSILRICDYSLCSPGMSKPRRLASYFPYSCPLYIRLLAIEISYVAWTGAGVSLLGIARRFTTTGIS